MELISVFENLDQAGLPVPRWITRRLRKVAKDISEDDPLTEEDEAEETAEQETEE